MSMDGRSVFSLFDRIAIIHLPERTDRLRALTRELKRIGSPIDGHNVTIPAAPIPQHANGFASRGVYGNFLSHLEILKHADRDQLNSVLVLEDDAIFSRSMVRQHGALIERLSEFDWGMCHLGHAMSSELANEPRGLIPYRGPFTWAHCYAVHQRALRKLIAFLERTLTNAPSHPEGSRMYIDGAFNHFRRLNTDLTVLVANPTLSSQRGSPTNLGRSTWHDGRRSIRPAISALRSVRDELWRQTGWPRPRST